jgi:hypothetical protein
VPKYVTAVGRGAIWDTGVSVIQGRSVDEHDYFDSACRSQLEDFPISGNGQSLAIR